MNRSIIVPCVVILLVLGCIACLCIILASSLGGLMWQYFPWRSLPIPIEVREPTGTPVVIRPTAQETPQASATVGHKQETPFITTFPTTTPTVSVTPVLAEIPTDTLNTLENSEVPINNLLDLSARLQDKHNIPVTLEPPATPFQVGNQHTFWVTNVDSNESFQINATLRYITSHLYFWIENGVDYDPISLKKLSNTFEDKIYPTDREFFGSEWTPGVDGDVHIYVLYAGNLGSFLAGYFSSADEYSPLAHIYSNAHEMIFINSDNQDLGSQEIYGTLTHEFQHMIHWYRDRNEDTWMNEGFSVLAEFLNNYSVYFDYEYVADPDLQLTDWDLDVSSNGSHYGGSFLFLDYFLDRFGDTATKALIAEPENGMVSIDKVLMDLSVIDPLTGQTIGADDVFMDWVTASYLQDGSVGDGRYTYKNYPGAPRPSETERFRNCPVSTQARDVHQYGVDYIRISCPGDYTLHFEGSTMARVVPADPHSGTYAFWSNKGDESDMTLTKTFDFTNQSGPLTFSYWTWYDLEKDFDYIYLEASLDGENWQILTTPSGTDKNPSGNSYGWGYNGYSGEKSRPRWILEKVDISQFTGKKVQLRFEYVTDAAVNGEGFLLDDVFIAETGYTTDFEKDNGGWEGLGFVRIENVLPQKYGLMLITFGNTTTVERITLNPDQTADIPLHIGGDVNEVVLVVSGLTGFTRLHTAYQFSILP